MRLNELAEILQPELEEGVSNFIIYQDGRQWKYEKCHGYKGNLNEKEEKNYLTIKYTLDEKAIIVNGEKDFSSFDLEVIQKQIKDLRK